MCHEFETSPENTGRPPLKKEKKRQDRTGQGRKGKKYLFWMKSHSPYLIKIANKGPQVLLTSRVPILISFYKGSCLFLYFSFFSLQIKCLPFIKLCPSNSLWELSYDPGGMQTTVQWCSSPRYNRRKGGKKEKC